MLNKAAIDDALLTGVFTALEPADLPPEFSGWTSVTPCIVFPWQGIGGGTVWQIRPDKPTGDAKYLFAKGSEPVLNVPPGERVLLDDPTAPVLVVEGTKQALAVASATLAMTTGRPAVVGVAGCWGWSKDGSAAPDVYSFPVGRDVFIAFDADVSTNSDVWDAASLLAETMTVLRGATSVRFVILPGIGTDGLDDVLARLPVAERPDLIARMMTQATAKLPRRPRESKGFVAGGGLRTRDLWHALESRHPMALTADKTIAVYASGHYHNGDSLKFEASVNALLGNDYRPSHLDAVREYGIGELGTTGRRIDEDPRDPLVNLANGILDLRDLTLRDHTPELRTLMQFGVAWDPTATCPYYDEWIAERTSQVDNLHEVIGQVFLPGTPTKAGFLYGPTRSGKSTILRLVTSVVGTSDTSAVTLHQLSDDRFASANAYGKRLNVAADISSRDVRDLSVFKMMTGEDAITANKKYGAQFTFINRALFLFSGNAIPAVGEASGAYMARMVPVAFPKSFLGKEDPTVEARLVAEMPGIMRRWVTEGALQVMAGQWTPLPTEVRAEFLTGSSAVHAFLAERTVPLNPDDPSNHGTRPRGLFRAFQDWSQETGRAVGMQEATFGGRVQEAGLVQKTVKGNAFYRVRVVVGGDGGSVWLADDPDSQGGGGEEGGALSHPAQRTLASADQEVSREGQVAKPPTLHTLTTPDAFTTPVVFDLETGTVADLWSAGPGYARLAGATTETGTVVTTDIGTVSAAVDHGLIAHNGFQFDFVVLARHFDLDILDAGEKGLLNDTKVAAALAEPPPFDMTPQRVEGHYSLNAVARRLGVTPKADDIRRLAALHGGFDKIPVDDPEYVAYCAGDVETTQAIATLLPRTDYAVREMRLLARLVSSVTVTGFRVDTDLLRARYDEGQARLAQRREWLASNYGLPTTRKDGTPSPAPHQTKEGKAAIAAAFKALGVDPDRWPESMRTKTGAPSFGKDALTVLLEKIRERGGLDDAVALAEVVLEMNGVRTVYGTVRDHLAPDGRVHPTISARQASGRLSITGPGLTVMGKRDGRWVEREVFLPESGHVVVAFDLDQIDARAVAAHSQDPAYLAMFGPGMDIHAEVAERVFGDRGRREEAKVIGHGWNYGMSVQKMVKQGIDRDLAEQFDARMRQEFPRLVAWKDEVRAEARGGALLDNGFGRKMRPDPERAYTQAPALMGQGTARDLMMEGILRLPIDVVPMLRAVVHDELVFSIPADDLEDMAASVLDALAFEWAPPGASRTVSITAGQSRAGSSWGACYH